MLGLFFLITIATVAIIIIIVILILSYSMLKFERQGDEEKAKKRVSSIQFISLLSGTFTIIFMSILDFEPITLFAMVIFLFVSYKGWCAFSRFVYFLYYKEKTRAKKSLLKGLIIAPFFILSLIFLLFTSMLDIGLSALPKPSKTYDACHDNNADWLHIDECTSRKLTVKDVTGKWQMLSNSDVKEGYSNLYFVLKEDKTVEFHAYYVTREAGYGMIEYKDINSTWELNLIGAGNSIGSKADTFHPYITIAMEKGDIEFGFDSGNNDDELYLQKQYDDFDAPHYLTYKRVEDKKWRNDSPL